MNTMDTFVNALHDFVKMAEENRLLGAGMITVEHLCGMLGDGERRDHHAGIYLFANGSRSDGIFAKSGITVFVVVRCF